MEGVEEMEVEVEGVGAEEGREGGVGTVEEAAVGAAGEGEE